MVKYRVQDGQTGENFEAESDEAALEYGEDWLEGGSWDRSQTIWLDAEVVRLKDDGEYADTLGWVRVTLHPEEPDCTAGSDHAWRSPQSVVGGCKENPGVWGSGGGVRSLEVCQHCGAFRITDTWATNPCDGTQGHTSVEYLPADIYSLKWVEQATKGGE